MKQKDFTLARCRYRTSLFGVVLGAIAKQYADDKRQTFKFAYPGALLVLATQYVQEQHQVSLLLDRSSRIAAVDFRFNFNSYGDREALLNFRFRITDILRLVPLLGWPQHKTYTPPTRYSCDPILATCVVLRRMAVPDRWEDITEMFGKHPSQMSEIFWETMELFIQGQGHLLLEPILAIYIAQRAEVFSKAIKDKGAALHDCIGFIDGTVVGVARPKGYMRQLVVYNGHKRKHALKYQATNTPDGMIVHAHGLIEGRRHDWFLYLCSGVEGNLEEIMSVDTTTYKIYGDSGYNWRVYMEVPFQGSNLNLHQKAFNTSMSRVRITVEWIFKEVKLYFPITDTKRNLKLCESPVGLLYLGTMLMCNLRNCLYPNQISEYFGVKPPTLEEYINER